MRVITSEDPKRILSYRPDPEKPHKRTYHNCKRCNAPYSLGIPYEAANHPARDLCSDCIVDLDPKEFYEEAWNTKPDEMEKPLCLDNPGDIIKIIREKLL
jgi:hypothetical protein